MNHALLTELQRLQAFPSVTLLHTTRPGATMRADDVNRLRGLVAETDRRLADQVDDEVRREVTDSLRRLVTTAASERSAEAIAICASPDHEAVVRLGRAVRTRAVIDQSFATRDLVADANRTASFQLLTISEQTIRLLAGDRRHLVEVEDDRWPIARSEDESDERWRGRATGAIEQERRDSGIPIVLAGVATTIGGLVDTETVAPVGVLAGNHDSTPASELHGPAWQLVHEWLERDHAEAHARLEHARGARTFAGGLDEVWDLAGDGRVELLVVEDDYRVAARVDEPHLEPVELPRSPDLVDDVVDELIEVVLQHGGRTVVVPPGELAEHERVAAVLRY